MKEVKSTDSTGPIGSSGSPLRFRACFHTPMSQAMLTETYQPYPGAEPLIAPSGFPCFDATAIGRALETGEECPISTGFFDKLKKAVGG